MTPPRRPPIVVLIAAGALVAAIGFGLWRWSRFNDLHVVNGLPVAVEISLDGKRSERVEAQTGRIRFDGVSAGTHVVEVKHDGRELETRLVFVKGGSHELVYDIGGAGPLMWTKIAYTKRAGGEEPQWQMFCGSHFVEVDDVDYLFVEPPRSISVRGGGTVYKTSLTLEGGGLEECKSWALDRGTLETWVDLQRLEARLNPAKLLYAVDELARQGDLREAQLMAEQAMEKDGSFELRRVHELLLLASDQTEKARSLYAREVNDEHATALDLYFSAVLKTGPERVAFLDEALLRFPSSPHLHWLKGQALDRAGSSEAAIAAYEAAERAGGPGLADIQWSLYGHHARALIRANRKPEAWALAASIYKDSPTVDGAVSYAQLARITGNSEAGWSAKLKPSGVRWGEALLDLPPSHIPKPNAKDSDWDPESFKRSRAIVQLTVRQSTVAKKPVLPPQGAFAAVPKAKEADLRMMPEDVVWLLLTEAWRTGDTAAAAKLSRQANGYSVPRQDDAAAFIATGVPSPRLDNVGDAYLAVLWLARGRRLATLGQDPTEAYAQVRRLDAFGSVVTRALDRWPAAQPGARLAWLPVPQGP